MIHENLTLQFNFEFGKTGRPVSEYDSDYDVQSGLCICIYEMLEENISDVLEDVLKGRK